MKPWSEYERWTIVIANISLFYFFYPFSFHYVDYGYFYIVSFLIGELGDSGGDAGHYLSDGFLTD